jgi:hypothetical protein
MLLLMALSTTGLLGLCGLGVDVNLFWTIKRRMQTAADAAAVAGAIALGNGSNYAAAAADLSSFNGFTNGQNGVTVTANNPPAGGLYIGDAKYLEVIVKQAQPTYFMRVLGYSTMTIAARATAGSNSADYCIYVLDPAASGALNINSGDVLTSSCGVIVNSASTTAITSSGTLNAPLVGVVGNYSGTINGTKRTNIAPALDPLAYLQAPVVGACQYTNYSITSGSAILNPGVYCGSNGSAAMQISGTASVTLNPGTYILNGGGLTMGGSGTLTGTGVTFYNTGTAATYGPINTQDQALLNLKAPTTGPLAGVLFFQDRSITFPTQANNIGVGPTGVLEGALYFPTTRLSLASGKNGTAKYTMVVAQTLNVAVDLWTCQMITTV